MGFKEIEKFNDALLAKQVWRLINNTDSLCHRVFKARFFPDCSILDAKDSNSGSYAWKSIIGARDVIRKGMVWRIGTGEAVRVKEDRWLPGPANCAVISPLSSLAPDAKVSSLIDPDRVAWRTEMVQQLFMPHEADIILGIPLSSRRPEDCITWAHTPSGMFTTCSAYKMLVSCDISTSAGGSNPDSQKKFWRSIWQLRVPNKIRHFVWKMCNNALPTLANLHRRNIVPSPSCAQCHNFPEDSLHAVWFCEAISGVWSTLEWFRQTAPPQPASFSELLAGFLLCRDELKAELFVIIAWLLWNRRNAIHFGRPPLPVENICSKAGSYLQQFLQAQAEEPVPTRPPIMQQWRPPESHCFKINFDAAVFRSARLAGIGVVVRNNLGEVEGALSASIPMAQSMVDLEALACLKVVHFALELGISRVVFEGDSAVVINALLQGAGAFASFSNILDDIRMLSAVFQFVDFVFVNRRCNSVADALAKKAKLIVGAQVWLHEVPANIAPLVLHNVH